MQRKLIKTLCFVSTVAYLYGCSTTRGPVRKHSRIEVCVPDPRNDSLQCVDENEVRQTRPFQTLPLSKYLCFPIDPITELLGDG